LPIAGEAYMGLGDIWLQWNDLEKAEKFILESIHLTEAWSDAAALEGYLALAHVRQAQRRADEVSPLIEKARQLAIRFETTDLDDIMVDISDARLSLLNGDVQTAKRWIEEGDVHGYLENEGWFEGEASLRDHIRKYEWIILSRIHIAQGQAQQALEILTPLLEMVRSLQRVDLIIEVLILQAKAQELDGNLEDAVSILKEVLSLAEDGNYVRIFVNEGPAMARLLYAASQQGISPEYCGRLLNAFPEEDQDTLIVGPLESEMVEPLSSREIEVLSLISEGLSNREIAEHLFLTLGTVKVHTRNIYGKLCVNNRTHAVAKARSIGIL
jgi:LuxR family maltose regulon positive regulatory protein